MNAREREGFAMLLQTLLAGTRGDNDEAPSSSTGEGGAIHLRPNAQETIDEPIEETINGPSCETYRNKHIVPGGKGYGKGPKLNLIGGGGARQTTKQKSFRSASWRSGPVPAGPAWRTPSSISFTPSFS